MGDDFGIAVAERDDLAGLLESVVRQYLQDAAIPAVNDTFEEVFGRYAIGRFPCKPQMRFFLEDLAAFTPELANRLRAQVLSRFEEWTVVPQYGEQEFTVAASGVWFGAKKITAPITEATGDYQRWLRSARRYDEECKGPLRRQFRYLTPLIPAAVPVVRKKQLAVLAAFDTFVPPAWEGHPVVWVLTRGGRKKPEMRPGYGGQTYTVTSKGAVEPEFSQKYWPATRVPSPFFLHAHEFSWKDRHRLELVLPGRADDVPDTVIHPVRVAELILDADLKVQQRRIKRCT
jgi:hypothetical protein